MPGIWFGVNIVVGEVDRTLPIVNFVIKYTSYSIESSASHQPRLKFHLSFRFGDL